MLALIAVLFYFFLFPGIGFIAGYRGAFKHSAIAVGTVQGLHLFLLTLPLFSIRMSYSAKGFATNILIAQLIVVGSLIGALLARRGSALKTIGLHGTLAGASHAIAELVEYFFRRAG